LINLTNKVFVFIILVVMLGVGASSQRLIAGISWFDFSCKHQFYPFCFLNW